jgi:hypothetical protein
MTSYDMRLPAGQNVIDLLAGNGDAKRHRSQDYNPRQARQEHSRV